MNPSLVCERIVFAFALWTIAVHLTVITAGNLYDLLICFVLLALLALVVTRSEWLEQEQPPVETEPVSTAKVQEALFWVLMVVVVVLTLTAHRPDEDDAFYVNLSVSAADAPAEAIQRSDRQHAVEEHVLIRRSSRLGSLVTLAAAASWLTGIPAITFPHLVFSCLAAVLVLLANRELFHVLAPKHWAFGVLAVVVFLCSDGEVHRTYGNFSFVRLHQGKAVLLSVFVPLLIAYGSRFALQPTRRGWLLLTAAQVGAAGCSSTGLLYAPIVANLAVVAGLGGRAVRQPGRLVPGLLSSAPVAAVGLWAHWPFLAFALRSGEGAVAERAVDLGEQLDLVSGGGRFEVFQVFVLLTAWAWCDTRIARRLCVVFPSVVGLLFLNRLTADFMGTFLVPVTVYWRTTWLLPMPAMAALTLLAPFTLRRIPLRPRVRLALFFLLLAVVPGVLSEQLVLARENRVEMRRPGLKVPEEYEIARRVAELVGGRATVLASNTVSPWIPTFHHHPYPLVSRLFYANRSRFRSEYETRLALKRYIMGRSKRPMAPHLFQENLERYAVACVVFEHSNRWREEIRSGLTSSGFERIEDRIGHEIWLRQEAP